MKSISLCTIFAFFFLSFQAYSQVPIQKIDFPSTSYFGVDIDVTEDGSFLAVVGSGSGGASSKVYLYELENNQYELNSIHNFNLEVREVYFSDDNESLIVGEGLSNIFRSARIFVISLSESGEWIKNDSIIEDPEEMNAGTGAGFNVSKNGNRVALGVPNKNKVYIYDILNPNEASLLGEIESTSQFYNYFGSSVGMSADGSRVSITTFDPSLTQVFDYVDGEWVVVHTVESYRGRTELSKDGKTLLLSNNNNIQLHTELENGTWSSTNNIQLHVSGGTNWNVISAEFNPEYNNISLGMLNASNQKTKQAVLDNVEGIWVERRSAYFDTEYSDYSGVQVATSIDGSLIVTSNPRFNNKGEVYVYNDLEGSALGVAAFRDRNRNGVFDADEFLFTDCEFIVNGDIILPALQGFNYASVFGATHNIEVSYDENVYLTTTDETYMFDHQTETLTQHLFGLDYIDPLGNSIINSSNSLMLCNTSDENFVNIFNDGSIPFYVELSLKYEDIIFENSTIEVIGQSDSTILLKTPVLQPGESLKVTNIFKMPDETATGETIALNIEASTYEEGVDEPIDVNSFDRSFTLRCSYDPNDKAVFPDGLGEEKLTLIDQDLLYRVRFQNTGNFPATNVVVKDVIDENLDISTFKFIEASHPITQVSIRDRKVDFVFENIMLADSVNNEPESHGYILFSVRPFEDISDYTLIENTAEIYFDFNSPIITNTTVSNMVESFPIVSAVDNAFDNFESDVYPNPVTEDLFLEIKFVSEVSIYSQSGKLVSKSIIGKGVNTISVSDLRQGSYFMKVRDIKSGDQNYHSFIKI